MTALLATLVLIFAFQADNITEQAAARRADRGADPDPGLLQLVADLRADVAVRRAVQGRRAGRA